MEEKSSDRRGIIRQASQQDESRHTSSNIWEQIMRSYGARLADETGKKVVLGDHKTAVWAFLDWFMEV